MLKGIQLITNIGKEMSCISKAPRITNLEGLRYAPELVTDAIKIRNKTPLAEFRRYIEGFKLEGEAFVPTSENPSSTFIEYFMHRKEVCVPKPAKKMGGISIGARPAPPKIIRSQDNEAAILSLIDFKNFMQAKSQFATKEEYYQVVDEIARLMPDYVRKAHPGLRPEIIENSGKIFKWRTLMDVEGKGAEPGVLNKLKFYDEEAKMQAIDEFTQFVEKLTGKKVRIGSPTRMTIAPDELGLLNDPASYKNVDYILFGHGTGSSLDGTWRFSDSGKSVWEFIEENVPRGKRVLVGTCEQDGRIYKERKALSEMYDKSGNYMYGIGNSVSASFNRENPAKICESGTRHIIGHTNLKTTNDIESFISGCYGKVENVYYDL